MSVSLQRITVQYVLSEDRIRFAGEDKEGKVWVLWMTQRILKRLIPHLCKWLEQREGDKLQDKIRHEFAQQKARSNSTHLAPVKVLEDSQSMLVFSVDVKTWPETLELLFKNKEGDNCAALKLQAQILRQWLNIVYDQYLRGEWSTDLWPFWVIDAKNTDQSMKTEVFH
jgi:hypothetical protein